MQMAGQDVMGGMRMRLVLQRERAEQQWLGDHLHAQAGGRIPRASVMVAAHECDVQGRVRLAPGEQRRESRR